MIDAIVLAGGLAGEISSEEASSKGLLDINGRPMVEYVVAALEQSDLIQNIVVVLPEKGGEDDAGAKVKYATLGSGSISSNILAGLSKLEPGSRNVLIVSADIPLLSREAIDDFIDKSVASGADICYPIIPEKAVKMRFPDSKRTYARLADGIFTGGNMCMVTVDVLRKTLDMFELIYEKRKSPFNLTRILGLRFVFKFLIGKMTITDVEKRLSKILGARGKAVQTSFPEVGFDIDKPGDLEIAIREMAVRTF